MAKLLKPDTQLAALETKLATAVTKEERAAIQEQIDARRSALMQETGFTNVGFASGGSFIPGAGQGVGSEILEPTVTPGVYSKSVIGTDTSVDPYGRQSLQKTSDPAAIGRPNYDPNATNKKVFYDENGKQLTPEQVVASGVGAAFTNAGWDIGYGPGNLPTSSSTDTTSTSTDTSFTSTDLPDGVTVVSTYADPTTGDVTAVLSNGTTKVLAKSGAANAATKSAYDLLYQQFNDLGIGALVPELRNFIEEGISPSEFTLRLRQTDSYKKRFAANAQRIAKGLRALSEAEYIGLEDQYQNVMRQYGLPENYYARGEMGRQEGFEKFISGDVSASELEDRIMTAQKRVINANPEVAQALRTFYPGISQGDILAYTLDPTKAIEDIKRKVTAAEIGGSAARFGLTTNVSDAEYLRNYGVTKEQADQGYATISGGLQRGSQLASMYGESPYTQATAEQEIFNVPGAAEARKQRQKITGLEKATFSGQTGLTSGALARDRAGAF
jgi:hypothetical protein